MAGTFAALPTRIALIRCPRARLESAYRARRQEQNYSYTRFDDFNEIVLYVFADVAPAPHVAPYAEQCRLANEVIKWDWPRLSELLGVASPHLNVSPWVEIVGPLRLALLTAWRSAGLCAVGISVITHSLPWSLANSSCSWSLAAYRDNCRRKLPS